MRTGYISYGTCNRGPRAPGLGQAVYLLVRIIYVYFIFINFKKIIVNFCRHFCVFWGMFEIY